MFVSLARRWVFIADKRAHINPRTSGGADFMRLLMEFWVAFSKTIYARKYYAALSF